MKNKEKYKNDIRNRICSVNTPWRKYICDGKECSGCALRFLEWCEQEVLPDLTGLETEVLRAIPSTFKYIARNKYGKLFVYYRKPKKAESGWSSEHICAFLPLTGLFDWITFEDAEPWCIDDFVKRND